MIIRKGKGRGQAGFTLVEMLVAMVLTTLMAGMAWQGLVSLNTAVEVSRDHADSVSTLEVGLSQWEADLDALVSLPLTRTLDWDGRALRLTRRLPGDEGAVVVCWTRSERNGVPKWLRWQSDPVDTLETWRKAWDAANVWVQAGSLIDRTHEVQITELPEWQLFYYRTGAWSSPLSSAGSALDSQSTNMLPEGIRLVLTMPQNHPLPGRLVHDWVRLQTAGDMP
ncbi:Prokaryotic N-terminal methylation site [Comamonadaceae bacterium]